MNILYLFEYKMKDHEAYRNLFAKYNVISSDISEILCYKNFRE